MTVVPNEPVNIAVPESRNISNSEVTAFLSCKRMYDFAFVDNLAPKVTPSPLARGSVGHEAFERYSIARLNSSNHEQAMKAGMEAFQFAMDNGVRLDTVMHAQLLWTRYMEYHNGWPQWRIIGAEQRHDLYITDTLAIATRYDTYVEEIASGKYLIGDYKFTYDFWSPADHDMNGQMPKYIGVLRANNFRVDGGFLEEIRTRTLGKEKASDPKNLWRRTPYFPSNAKVLAMLRQHVSTSLEIQKHRSLAEADRISASIPVLNKHGACKFCNFTDLCNSMNEGKKDLTVDKRSGYTENTYGYNKQVMEELL